MVTVRTFCTSILCGAVVIATVASCSSGGGAATRAGRSPSVERPNQKSPIIAESQTSTRQPTPPTPTPLNQPCMGISGVNAAVELVEGGATVAVVAASITNQVTPESWSDKQWTVTVSKSHTIAGSLSNGPLSTLEAIGELPPPGDYLLLLGAGVEPGDYFLSDGLRGSFELDGDNAYQRCPTKGEPGTATAVHGGVTNVSQLGSIFDEAIKRVAAMPTASPTANATP